jgi:hypothetical protein
MHSLKSLHGTDGKMMDLLSQAPPFIVLSPSSKVDESSNESTPPTTQPQWKAVLDKVTRAPLTCQPTQGVESEEPRAPQLAYV